MLILQILEKENKETIKAEQKKPGDIYLWTKIWINILAVVFVVEALKKALLAHDVVRVALTPWTLFSLFIKVSQDHKRWHQNCKMSNLTTSPDIKLQPHICFLPEEDYFKKRVTYCDACAVIWCTLHVLVLHCSIVYVP